MAYPVGPIDIRGGGMVKKGKPKTKIYKPKK